MRILTGVDEEKARYWFLVAAKVAEDSQCYKSKRGVIIIKDDRLIGKGSIYVPDDTYCKPCIREHIHDNSRIELCGGLHAERMAIMDAKKVERNLENTTMYHIKVKEGELRMSGKPSCTMCSREILSEKIGEFVLWHKEGITAYTAKELNDLSFQYFLKPLNTV